MDAPQTGLDIAPFLAALRRLDPLLDIRWNPEAVVTAPGRFDEYGLPIPPRKAGRWEIWRQAPRVDTDAPRGEEQRIWIVTLDGVEDGDYMPIDGRIVQFMYQWDAANSEYVERRKREQAEDDRLAAERGQFTYEQSGLLAEHFAKYATDVFHLQPAVGTGFGKGPRRTED